MCLNFMIKLLSSRAVIRITRRTDLGKDKEKDGSSGPWTLPLNPCTVRESEFRDWTKRPVAYSLLLLETEKR